MGKRPRFSATTCHSATLRTGSSGPTSSAMRARRGRSSRCWRTCSSAARPATTTGSWTSVAPSPAAFSSCRPWTCWSLSFPSRARSLRFVRGPLENKAVSSAFFGDQLAPCLERRQLLPHSGDIGSELLRRRVSPPGLGEDLPGSGILNGRGQEESQDFPFTFREPHLGLATLHYAFFSIEHQPTELDPGRERDQCTGTRPP